MLQFHSFDFRSFKIILCNSNSKDFYSCYWLLGSSRTEHKIL